MSDESSKMLSDDFKGEIVPEAEPTSKMNDLNRAKKNTNSLEDLRRARRDKIRKSLEVERERETPRDDRGASAAEGEIKLPSPQVA